MTKTDEENAKANEMYQALADAYGNLKYLAWIITMIAIITSASVIWPALHDWRGSTPPDDFQEQFTFLRTQQIIHASDWRLDRLRENYSRLEGLLDGLLLRTNHLIPANPSGDYIVPGNTNLTNMPNMGL